MFMQRYVQEEVCSFCLLPSAFSAFFSFSLYLFFLFALVTVCGFLLLSLFLPFLFSCKKATKRVLSVKTKKLIFLAL